jgi:antitoxin component YwqK of YwqJK toxin-antitoxin module
LSHLYCPILNLQGCKDSKYHGNGKSFYENGNVEYEGEWENDEMNGNGKKFDEDGMLTYEGEFKNGERNGNV